MQKAKFINLDAMRGIAAIFVFIRHTDAYWGNFGFYHSYLAVDIFFILSGFVIANAYDSKIVSNNLSKKDFILTRLIRLYPMYLVGLVLGIGAIVCNLLLNKPFNLIQSNSIGITVLLSLFFIPGNWGSGQTLFPLNPPSWSLFYELAVNILYGLSAKLLSLRVLVATLILCALIISYVAAKKGGLDIGAMAGPKSIFAAFIRSLFGILYGVLLYKIHIKGFVLPSIVKNQFLTMLTVSAILMTPDLGSLNWSFDLFAIFILIPLSVIGSAEADTRTWSLKASLFLGAISYPLYVIHKPLDEIFKSYFADALPHLQPMAGVALLIITILASVILAHTIDTPMRKQLTQKLLKKSKSN